MSARYPQASRVALLLILLGLLHPAHGLGVPLCVSRLLTAAPCPGCGLTRSVSCSLRGDLPQAVRYHALGPLVAAALVLTVLWPLVPPAAGAALMPLWQRWRLWVVAGVTLLLLLGYGALRLTNPGAWP